MLHEWFYYLGTKVASPGARKLGYAKETAALEVRHHRCREAWKNHVQSTNAALLAAAQTAHRPGGTALIVGGGVARDLPMEELLTQFERIVLLDIAFSLPTRYLAISSRGRVLCCYWDVTGVVDWLAHERHLPPGPVFTRPILPELNPNPCWVASVNCLTQLPLLPLDWLLPHGIDEFQLEAFGRNLIHAHLDWLSMWQVPHCLITEISDYRYDANGIMTDTTDYQPIIGHYLKKGRLLARWSWCVHPAGEIPTGAHEIRMIEAWVQN